MVTRGSLSHIYEPDRPGTGVAADGILATDADGNAVTVPAAAIPDDFDIRTLEEPTVNGQTLTLRYTDNDGTARTRTVELPTSAVTDAHIAEIVAEHQAQGISYLTVDVAFVARGSDIDGGGNNNSRDDDFTVSGHEFTARRYYYAADDSKFELTLNSFTDAQLNLLKNDGAFITLQKTGEALQRYSFVHPRTVFPAQSGLRKIEWNAVAPLTVGTYTVRFEAPGVEVPEATAAGQYIVSTAVGTDERRPFNADVNALINTHPSNSLRTLFNGSTPGINVTALNADSSIQKFNLTDGLNLNTEPHGLVEVVISPVPTFVASDIAFEEDVTDNTVTLDTVARAPIYNGSTNLGAVIITADLNKGATLVGSLVVRMDRDDTGATALNIQYKHHAGHSLTDTGSIAATLEVYVQGSGAPRQGAGRRYTFNQDALPSADNFVDNDWVLMWKANSLQGLYVKESSGSNHAADTGLQGLTLAPTTDLISNLSGAIEHVYFTRLANIGGDTNLPRGGTWADAPATLDTVDLGYRSATLDSGYIRLSYNAARTYAGSITISADFNGVTEVVTLDRVSSTEWYAEGFTHAQVAAFRRNTWTFAEPGATGYVVTHTLVKVLEGEDNITNGSTPAIETLVDYTWTSSPQAYTQRQFLEIPAEGAFSRTLTAADDNRLLVIQIRYSGRSGGTTPDSGPVYSTPVEWPVSFWRAARAKADDAAAALPNYSNVIYDGQTFAVWDNDSAAEESWSRGIMAKGTNGRPGFIINRTGTLLGVRAYLK